MINLVYTIKQIYNDDNIKEKPYPYCPVCKKLISLIVHINDNIYYEIICKYNYSHFTYMKDKNLTKLIKKWNQYCANYISNEYAQFIHKNIVTIDFSLIAIFIGICIFLQNSNLFIILAALIIHIPYLFTCLLKSDVVTFFIKQKIIDKTIDNSSFYSTDEINIQEQVEKTQKLYSIMQDLTHSSFSSSTLMSTINILLKNYKYFKNHTNDISNEYIHTLNEFYHILSSMNIDEDSNIFNDFYKYFKQVSTNISLSQQTDIYSALGYVPVQHEKTEDFTLFATSTTPQFISNITFDGTKHVINYAICYTNGNKKEKIISVDNFVLTYGATVIVTFIQDNMVNSPLLHINNTGAKLICYESLPFSDLKENHIYHIVYDGVFYQIVAEEDIHAKETKDLYEKLFAK